MKKFFSYPLALAGVLFLLSSCSQETDNMPGISDAALNSLVKQTDLSDYSNPVTKNRSEGIRILSSLKHSAASKGLYANNTLFVKEYHDARGAVTAYDVMYKASADPSASDGWLWASFDADGNTTYSVNMRGATCKSCHGGGSEILSGR